MYGFWILAIIFGIISALALITEKVGESLEAKYREELRYMDGDYSSTYEGYNYEKKRISAEELPKYEENLKKHKFWKKFNYRAGFFLGVIHGVLAFCFLIVVIIAIVNPITAKVDYVYWKEFVPMVEDIVGGSSEYQALGITSDIIEYNKWLTHARTSQEVWGNWSSYYNIDLSDLRYISIGQ